jgi:excisionase family DNA binding protein
LARFVRIKEVAAYTHLKVRTIRSYVLDKQIPHIKVKGCLVFDLDAIDSWMKEHERNVSPESIVSKGDQA